jgi:hypothetical protein
VLQCVPHLMFDVEAVSVFLIELTVLLRLLALLVMQNVAMDPVMVLVQPPTKHVRLVKSLAPRLLQEFNVPLI